MASTVLITLQMFYAYVLFGFECHFSRSHPVPPGMVPWDHTTYNKRKAAPTAHQRLERSPWFVPGRQAVGGPASRLPAPPAPAACLLCTRPLGTGRAAAIPYSDATFLLLYLSVIK